MSELSKSLDKILRLESKNRCGYCLSEQRYILSWLEIEHIFPRALGGTSERENLWLACTYCNTFKSTQTHGVDPKTKRRVSIFNPRTQVWKHHFEFSADQVTIIGKTKCGRATVQALNLNFDLALETRKHWVGVGWYPPNDFDD
jgi:HNH endonuclease